MFPIYLKGRTNKSVRETRPIWFIAHMPAIDRSGPAWSRSWELGPGLPCDWLELSHLGCYLQVHILRELARMGRGAVFKLSLWGGNTGFVGCVLTTVPAASTPLEILHPILGFLRDPKLSLEDVAKP